MNDLARQKALRMLRQGASYNQVAKAVGVHRTTVIRWKKNDSADSKGEVEPVSAGQSVDFVFDKQISVSEDLGQSAKEGLMDLLPKSLKVLDDSLSGSKKYSATQIRAALDIVKKVAELDKSRVDDTDDSFAARLEALGTGTSD